MAVINGDGGNNDLLGTAVADTINGLGGDDLIEGGAGPDVLDGGADTDTLSYASSLLAVTVRFDIDLLSGGDAQGDSIANFENLTGSSGHDSLYGDDNDNVIRGGDGFDTISGMGGNDTIYGGEGFDSLYAVPGASANGGDNTFYGEGGNDRIFSGSGSDTIDGGADDDTADYWYSISGVTVNLETGFASGGYATGDVLTSIESLWGSNHNDVLAADDGGRGLSGRGGDDTLTGGDGDDWLEGGQGSDHLDGGAGEDWANFVNASAGVAVDLESGVGTAGEANGDTYSGIENIYGTSHSDTLLGDGNNNTINAFGDSSLVNGRGGDDRLNIFADDSFIFGGPGDDYLFENTSGGLPNHFEGGDGADYFSFSSGSQSVASYQDSPLGVTVELWSGLASGGEAEGDTFSNVANLRGSAFSDLLIGTTVANSLDGGAGNDELQGLQGSDELEGNSGNDTLLGGSGDDVLDGGSGGDILDGGEGVDIATFAEASSYVRVDLLSPGKNHGDAIGDEIISIERIIGSDYNDSLNGNGAANTFLGGIGNDLLNGRKGNDVLEGGVGADSLVGGGGIDVASYSNASSSVIVDLSAPGANTGEAAGDTFSSIEGLVGSSYDDTLNGDSGANMFDGGVGWDATSYAASASAVSVDLASPASNLGDALGDTYVSIEEVTGSAFGDTLKGDEAENILSGSDGNDTLMGRGGSDQLDGGDGIDTASYAEAAIGLVANLVNSGENTEEAAGDTYTGIENLTGSDYNDVLIGDSGANRLDGGDGLDTTSYESALSYVRVELLNSAKNVGDAQGDELISIEKIIGSVYNDSLNGNGSANALIGGAGRDFLNGRKGDDVLEGGVGADVLSGGVGFDLASYASASTGVSVDLSATGSNTGDAAGDTFTSIEGVAGSTHNDVLAGNTLDNLLFGWTGDDLLRGAAGADVLDGGSGVDTASYSGAASFVRIDLQNLAKNRGDALGDTFNSVEKFVGSDHNDSLNGDRGANDFFGGDGADFLNGRKGNDMLEGGAGPDTLNGGGGLDTASYSGASSFVRIDLLNSAKNVGDALGDVFNSIESISGSSHNDSLNGNGEANSFLGGAGNDFLNGRNGNDTLVGGTGNDILVGGGGDDLFVFGGDFGEDRINDFAAGAGSQDTIDLSNVSGVSDFDELLALASDSGSDAILDFGGGNKITLINVAVADLHADDFIFPPGSQGTSEIGIAPDNLSELYASDECESVGSGDSLINDFSEIVPVEWIDEWNLF